MFTLDDVENIEVNDCDSDTFYRSIQRAINDGLWDLQGSYGRTMMEAIDNGCCLLGKKQFTDYYGNIIPSRFQVTSKTKGSMEFVKKTMGKDWLDMMVELWKHLKYQQHATFLYTLKSRQNPSMMPMSKLIMLILKLIGEMVILKTILLWRTSNHGNL